MPRSQRNNHDLTQSRLKELLHYEPSTGVFRWKKRFGVKEGKIAGCIKPGDSWSGGGYRVIRVDFVLHRASHLAWLYVHGRWPEEVIDHIDMDRAHDALDNLREATHSQNNVNGEAHSTNQIGIRGVGFDKDRGKYKAQIMKRGKQFNLGRFDRLEDAVAARNGAAKRMFGDFARLS